MSQSTHTCVRRLPRCLAAVLVRFCVLGALWSTGVPQASAYLGEHPLQPRPEDRAETLCYTPDVTITPAGSNGDQLDPPWFRNGLYQRWMWCGTSCWLLINDVDKEIVIIDGYVSKDTIGDDSDNDGHSSGGLGRIQKLANFIRWLADPTVENGANGYAVKGIIVMHWHGDHTFDVIPLLQALGLAEFPPGENCPAPCADASCGCLWTDYELPFGYVYSSTPPLYAPVPNAAAIPVIVDENTAFGFIHGLAFSGNPSDYIVKFWHPGCTDLDPNGLCNEMAADRDFQHRQRFNISRALAGGGDMDSVEEPCPDCKYGQFKLGHFEFNAYVWDHLGWNNLACLGHALPRRDWRTMALRVWHDEAPDARIAFITGSAGEMTDDHTNGMFDTHNGHSHSVASVLDAADAYYGGGHRNGKIPADLVLPAFPSFKHNTTDLCDGLVPHHWMGVPHEVAESMSLFTTTPCPLNDPSCFRPQTALFNHHDHNDTTDNQLCQDIAIFDDIICHHWTNNFDDHANTWNDHPPRPILRRLDSTRLAIDYSTAAAIADYRSARLTETPPTSDGGPDRDCDGVKDVADNCPLAENTDQDPQRCAFPHDGCVVPFHEPLAWWTFDASQGSGSNTTYEDITDNANDAQTASIYDSLAWINGGRVDGSLLFDGTFDWLTATAESGHDPRSLTIEGWVHPDRLPRVGDEWGIIQWGLSSDRSGYAITYGTYLHPNNGGRLYILLDCDSPFPGAPTVRLRTNHAVNPNEWTHIALVHDQAGGDAFNDPTSSFLRVYINGKPTTLSACTSLSDCDGGDYRADTLVNLGGCSTSSFAGDWNWTIGLHDTGNLVCKAGDGSSRCFDGRIDELTVYECPLSTADIRSIAKAGPLDLEPDGLPDNDGHAGKCKDAPPPPVTAIAAKALDRLSKTVTKATAKVAKDVGKAIKRCIVQVDNWIVLPDECRPPYFGKTLVSIGKAVEKFHGKLGKLEKFGIDPHEAGYLTCDEAQSIVTWIDVANCLEYKARAAVDASLAEALPGALSELSAAAAACRAKIANAQGSIVSAGITDALRCQAGLSKDFAKIKPEKCPAYPRGPLCVPDTLAGKLSTQVAKAAEAINSSCDVPGVREVLPEFPICPDPGPGNPFPTDCLIAEFVGTSAQLFQWGFELL